MAAISVSSSRCELISRQAFAYKGANLSAIYDTASWGRFLTWLTFDLGHFEQLQQHIGYSFRCRDLGYEALCHRSAANAWNSLEQRAQLPCNERLELLGDSVFGMVTTEAVFSLTPPLSEGDITRLRSKIVCQTNLAKWAKSLRLGTTIFLGPNERRVGVGERDSVLADTMEALLGAIYLDGGMMQAKAFIMGYIGEQLHNLDLLMCQDERSHLQELVQGRGQSSPHYEVVASSGPDHRPTWQVAVHIDGIEMGRGVGSSKKSASRHAARDAVQKYANPEI